ncbi:adhesion G-protein coupled receptor G4 isoform X2 [Alosa alosa]|uniref:adhesion G-protein coupled receptor G4 isoform X2 n=1 Tax=Alosa alosa TaxID=278164 RepID=UPI0020154C96|nr:adhesion G-protein coupled receptor G4 isoform X2 [Alosa alosa]
MQMKMDSIRVHMSITTWLWITSLHMCSGSPNLSYWGRKVSLMGQPCYWQLSDRCVVPELKELSVCITFQRDLGTSDWTAFDYKQRGKLSVELGLTGSRKQLKVWLFGKENTVDLVEDLALHQWHTICLTWSATAKKLQVYLNDSSLKEIHINGSQLAGCGMLTLGVSHNVLGGVMNYETGKELMGSATLFRMWSRVLAGTELAALRCVEGDVVRWSQRDWSKSASYCQAEPDSNLICEWQKYEIAMIVSIESKLQEKEKLKIILQNWFKDTFHSNISVHGIFISSSRQQLDLELGEQLEGSRVSSNGTTAQRYDCLVHVEVTPKKDVWAVQEEIQRCLSPPYHHADGVVKAIPGSLTVISVEELSNNTESPLHTTGPPALSTASTTVQLPSCTSVLSSVAKEIPDLCNPDYTDGFFQDTFYRVILNASINITPTNPENSIQNWLNVTLNPNHMTVLNFVMTPELPISEKFLILHRYTCTFHVQAQSLNVTETKKLIVSLLTKPYTTGSEFIEVLPGHINVSHIAPGSCPDHDQHTLQGLFPWPKTEPQETAIVLCEKNQLEKATRFCKLDGMTDIAMWEPPDLSSCERIVDGIADLDKVNVTANNSGEVVDLIGSLVSNQTNLSHSELDTVLNKLEDVVAISPISPNMGENIMEILSDILHCKADLVSFTNKILGVIESVGDQMDFNGETHNMTVPSMALQLVNVNSSQFRGLTFGVSSFTSDNSPQIFVNETFVEKPFTGAVASISLPSVLENFFPQNNTVRPRIQFQFFDSGGLFKNPHDNMTLNTYVVSASVTNINVSNLHQPTIITLRHLNRVQAQDQRMCVYWDVSKSGGGGWESQGCVMWNTDDFQTTCQCNHLTHFGVLLDVSKAPISELDEQILVILSFVGCGLSSVFLGVTLLTYLAFEKLRQDYPSKILINLCVALLGLNLVFLVNSWLASFDSRGLCVGVAAIQHFFVLASFTWMGLEALHMYFALVKVFNVYVPSYILKLCAFGWGLPATIIILILAIDKDIYGSEWDEDSQNPLQDTSPFCWVQNDNAFYVSVMGFIILVLLCNMSVFGVVLIQIRRMQANKISSSSTSGLAHDLRVVASLTFLLGLTWILPFFSWGMAAIVFTYLFAILNTLQGFFIFIFHCLMKENVQKQWRIHLCCGPLRPKDYSDWSRSVTGEGRGRQVRSPSVKSEDTSSMRKISDTSISSVNQMIA